MSYNLTLAGLVAALCYIGARISLNFVVQPEDIAVIWLPAAILPAVLLLINRRIWPLVIVSAFVSIALASWSGGNSILISLGCALADCIEGTTVATLLTRWGVTATNINTVRSILTGGAAAVAIAALVAAVGTTVLVLFADTPFGSTWLIWFTEDGVAILLGLPLILSWVNLIQERPRWPSLRRWVETTLFVASLCALGWLVFMPGQPYMTDVVLFPYVLVSLLVWGALRFRMHLAASFSALVAGFALWGTASGGGAFYMTLHMTKPSLLTAQFFAAVIAFTTYLLRAVVDDRERALEGLRRSELKFRSVIEQSTDGIVLIDENGTVLEWNPAEERHTGISRACALGRPIWELIVETMPQEKRTPNIEEVMKAGVLDNLAAYRRGTERQSAIYELELPSGGRRIVDYTFFPVKTAMGFMAGAVSQDITGHKQVEDVLRESEQRYRAIAESAHDAIITADANGDIVAWNRGAQRMFGYDRAEIIGQPLERLMPDRYRESHRSALRGVDIRGMRRNLGTTVELHGLRKDGIEFPLELSLAEWGAAQGTFFTGIIRDITKRKQAEEARRRSEQHFHAIFDLSPLGITIADSESGRYIEVNPRFCAIIGRSRDEMLQSNFQSITYPDDLQADLDFMVKLRAGEVSHFVMEKRYLRPDNSIVWVNMNVVPLWLEKGEELRHIALVEDITERRLAENLTRSRLHLGEYALLHSLDDLLRETLDEAERLTYSQIGFFHFVDDDQQVVTLQSWSTNTLHNMSSAEAKGTRYAVNGAGVWADCVRQRRPVIHNDYASLPHLKGLPEGHEPVIRELVVPIFRHEHIVAIMGVGNRTTNYGAAEVKILSELANIAWDIVVHKRAEETLAQHIEQVTRLSQASHRISGVLDADWILKQAVQMIHDLFNYDQVGVFILDDQAKRLDLRASAGQYADRFPEGRHLELGQGIVGTAARNRRTMRSDDVGQTQEYYNPFTGRIIWSEIAVPMLLGDTLVGVLDIQTNVMNAFSNTDVMVLETLAAQLSIGLQNARLFETEQHERTLAQTYQRAIEAMIEFDTIEHALDQVAGLLGDLIAFDRLIILLVEDDELKVVAHREISHEAELTDRTYRYPEIPLLYKSMSDVETLILPHGEPHPDYLDLPGYTTETTSWVGIPLPTSSVVIGYMCTATDRPNGYSKDDVQTLNAFARQVVLALGHSRLLAQIEQSHAHLTRLARLSAAGEIATGVAHQINNPLTAVVTQAHLLMSSSPPDSEAYQRGSKIENAALRAANVVQRMLDLARAHPQSMTTLDLNKSIADAISLVRAQIEPHIAHIVMDLYSHELLIEGSEDHLLDVWLNLLLNARDALEGVADARITVSTFLADDMKQVCVRIADNGPGIPPEGQARIFDPFVTSKPHGTGLGLSICHEIISQHGGTIILETPVARGASFLISLPITCAAISNKGR